MATEVTDAVEVGVAVGGVPVTVRVDVGGVPVTVRVEVRATVGVGLLVWVLVLVAIGGVPVAV
jgi:hypothetical protein